MANSVFSNAVAVITGAASGMGRYMAIQAAERGAYVIALDKNADGLAETESMAKAKGQTIETKVLDVSDAAAIAKFAEEATSKFNKRKLILINNAGVALLSGTFEHTPMEDFEWLININLWGVIRMTKAFYPYLIASNEGHVVNISSVFGLAGMANNSAYCTAKFGVRGFTETIRMELMGTNIGTTVVHPGGIKTNIVNNAPARGNYVTEDIRKKTATRFTEMAMTTADNAARQILDAVEKKQEKLVIGPDGKLMNVLTRLFPVRYTKIMKRQMDKMMEGVEQGK
ncbi:MAG TPA: SDR family NAD(P)-dependent oxidoreductase [Chitinophagales bacterium]|nr:SDR family NAD(P)-dependent oxidoreductase [Chitinophagales bacterium]